MSAGDMKSAKGRTRLRKSATRQRRVQRERDAVVAAEKKAERVAAEIAARDARDAKDGLA